MQEALRLQLVWLRAPRPLPSRGRGAVEQLVEQLRESPLCRLVRDEERRAAEEAVMLAESTRAAGRADCLKTTVLQEEREAKRQLRDMRQERSQLQVPGTSKNCE